LTAFGGRIAEFRERQCDVLGVSTDPLETHERWLGTPPWEGGMSGLSFPLASDADGAVCRAYGVYVARQHLALRGLFIIDPNGVLQYQVVHNLSVGRSTEEVLRVLEGLQMGGLCPGERQRGEPGLDVGREVVPGRVLGPYRIEAVLGGGAFGTVFRAHDASLDRTVALKVLSPGSPVPPQALLAEARAAAAVVHPNVCTIHAVDASLGAPVIVMEYVDGRPLSRLLDERSLSSEAAAVLARQVAQGMAAAHAQGVVHGDLKPANILVASDGTAKVMDFGMARRSRPAGHAEDTILWDPAPSGGISGTPAYMAPEQARGEAATSASDVFSLGLILYEMVTGQRARAGDNILEVLRGIDRDDPAQYAAGAPEPFAGILRLALVTDPAERRITMAQIADRLA
jgi:serine/threonine protein kinase/peroxiredoxin